ncbi:hypothetical protein IIY59_02475 [Candidatus Saccharibacteria bacterium]|nr:hypothetical protein [Candidatus Saccharibacteria bacterium]
MKFKKALLMTFSVLFITFFFAIQLCDDTFAVSCPSKHVTYNLKNSKAENGEGKIRETNAICVAEDGSLVAVDGRNANSGDRGYSFKPVDFGWKTAATNNNYIYSNKGKELKATNGYEKGIKCPSGYHIVKGRKVLDTTSGTMSYTCKSGQIDNPNYNKGVCAGNARGLSGVSCDKYIYKYAKPKVKDMPRCIQATRVQKSGAGNKTTTDDKLICESKAGAWKTGDDVNKAIANYLQHADGVSNVDVNGATDPGTFFEEAVTASDPEEEGSDAASCYDGGSSVGWILCPVVDKIGEAFEGFYDKYLAPAMKLDASLLENNSGTHDAWGIFRDMANMAFIALFLFVIFSQLTGVGIDNYGIKKTLPKLILTAVLINVSYIICQLAADVSNIVGYGVKDLLFSIADGIQTSVPDLGTGDFVALTLIMSLATGAGLLAIIANPALFLTGLIALISAVIAFAFLFVLLAARKAAIVLLVAVSPIAMVLYSLPNTKSIFDKWFNFFKTMLMVFPIAGFMMGAGQLASKIILSTGGDDKLMWIIGLIVSGVPIFFIPSLIKQSMSVMGSLGTRLAGMGSALSSGAKSRMTNSRLNQAAQLAGTRRRARLRAGVDKNGNIKKNSLRNRFAQSGLGRVTGARASMESARSDYKKMVKDEGARGLLMDDEMYSSDIGNIRYDAEKAMYDQRVGDMVNGTEIQSFLDQAIQDNNGIAIASAAEKLEAIGELDKLTESIMGVGYMKDKDGKIIQDANGNAVMRKGIKAEALKDDTFKARVGNTMIGLKKSSPHLGAYGAYLKNGGSGSIVDAAAGRGLDGQNTKSLGEYMQGFGDSILADADKTSLEAMGTLAKEAGVSTSSFVNDSQVAAGISGLSSDKARKKFVGAGFISSRNQESVARRLTTGRGINDEIANQIGYANLRSNTTLVNEARSQNVSGLDSTYVSKLTQ